MSAKIIELDVQNVMRVKAVHIKPDGNVVILGGRNAQGKTSVLDAISVAIGGMKLCPDVPIREGEDAAEVSLTLGELQITRKFKRTATGEVSSSLVVKNAEGQPLSPPQRTLDALIGRLAFDPLEFARMKPTDARETLRELVGLDVEQQEEELGRIFRERTEAGVAKRAAQAVVDELPVPGEVPVKTSTDEITARMAAAARAVADHEELKGKLHRAEQDRESLAAQIEVARAAIKEREEAIGRLSLSLLAAEAIRDQAKLSVQGFDLPNVEEIREQLDQAMHFNQNADEIFRAVERYQEKEKQAEVAAVAWKYLDTKHNDIFHEIKRKTEAVEYPIPDLELRKEGVFYQGVPFEQGSRAERIKVSLAMGVAMNEDLGVLLIRDGSVLDDESMTVITRLADEHDFQFWIEMARGYEDAAGAVIIEDGEVVG
jgi:DNA repair exonuclease SbcCD ATPase subunit